MRQILVMILGVGVFAVPARAVVLFTATDDGYGRLRIGYDTTDGDYPRGIALRVSCSNGAVVDLASTAAAKSWDQAFNIFTDYAYSHPENYKPGDGHPRRRPPNPAL